MNLNAVMRSAGGWDCSQPGGSDGDRYQLAEVELDNREGLSSCKELMLLLRKRSLHDVEFVVSENQAGLRRQFTKFCPKPCGSAAASLSSQFPRIPAFGKPMTWGSRYPKLCSWAEDNVEETLSFC